MESLDEQNNSTDLCLSLSGSWRNDVCFLVSWLVSEGCWKVLIWSSQVNMAWKKLAVQNRLPWWEHKLGLTCFFGPSDNGLLKNKLDFGWSPMIFIAVCIHLVILAFDCAVTNPCRDSTGGSPLSHNKSEPSSEVQPSSTLEQTPPHGPSTSVCYLCACLGSE